MVILMIQHPVPDWNVWKSVFDSDPVGRQQHGVTRYWVYRDVEDPNYVVYSLEFSTVEHADAFRNQPRLREAQSRYRAKDPQARVLEEVESVRTEGPGT
ncbi:MAG: hypothetical protein M3O70_07055 [Actinomycetota bacterium]|nr:hypothetical protein [Actinomycetota bacterium]